MKIFISYSRIEASETANTLHNYLSEYGHHEVFIDTSDIRGGDEWWNTIQNAISECDIFVIIVTRSALERQYIKEEVELAKKLKKRIIPCISKRYIRNVVLPLDLNKYQGIEYENLDQLIQEMGHMFESLEKYQSKQPDPTFIDKQNLEIPTQNGKNSAIDSTLKEESVSHPTVKNTNKIFLKGFKPKIIIIPIIAVVVAVVVIGLTVSIIPNTQYKIIDSWESEGNSIGQFQNATGIAVDSSKGYVYIADRVNGYILMFNSSGTLLKTFTINATGIAVDFSKNEVYVSNHGLQKINSDDKIIEIISEEYLETMRRNPTGIAVDSSKGYVYVADNHNDQILKFDSYNETIYVQGSYGNEDGEFSNPTGIAVDSSKGYVYVADSGNNRIQKFYTNFTFIKKWGDEGRDDGKFYVPSAIAVDLSGYVYVADMGNNRIQKFDSNGNFIMKWGNKGNEAGQFDKPTGIAIDPSTGYIYVIDSGNNRIQVFAPSD